MDTSFPVGVVVIEWDSDRSISTDELISKADKLTYKHKRGKI